MDFFQNLFPTKDAPKVTINIDSKIRAVAFVSGERPRIASGEENTIQLRNLDNLMGEPIEPSIGALAVAASNDGRWVVTGSTEGFAIWNVERGTLIRHPMAPVRTIDVSSDSKWVITGSDDWKADVWDISTGERHPDLGQLRHEYNVISVKFCPCGERIATATLFGSVRIFSTSAGKKLFTIPISVIISPTLSIPNVTFAWSALHVQVFAISQGQVKCLNSEDGSIIFQWALRGVSHPSSVVLSPNSKIVAYTLNTSVVLGDPATRKQIGESLKHEANVTCIAFSSGGDVLVAGADTKFTIWDLRKLGIDASYFDNTPVESPPPSCTRHKEDMTKKPPPTHYPLPLMSISNGAVKGWLHSFLDYVEDVFSKEIEEKTKSAAVLDHDVFANRAIVRERLAKGLKDPEAKENMWKNALEDATESLRIRPSPIGWIAKSIAFIHLEDYASAKQTIPHISQSCESGDHEVLLKVIQSILRCLSGEYDAEKTHIDRLSGDQHRKLLLLVQANMHLSENHFDDATASFNKARMPAIFPHDESRDMWTIAFIFGWKFSGLVIQIQQRKCQFLLDAENSKAADLFVEVKNTYAREIATHVELSDWSSDFRKNCLAKLEARGDRALNEKDYLEAINQYTAIEPLIGDLDAKFNLLLKRSEAHAEYHHPDSWMKALQDAEEAIKLNPMSPWGYDRKHIVLYTERHFGDAAEALNQMIISLSDSPDSKSKALRDNGMNPRETRKLVVQVVDETLSLPRPLMLMNTESGRLCEKEKQAEAFRAHPKFKDLILRPTSEIISDKSWKKAIQQYFRYSTMSHTWEDKGEPVFRDLEWVSVDRLPDTFSNKKLQTFCKITYGHGYLWAWSDTCCIKKEDPEVLSLSLRSMYRWYSESSLTIVHLKGVLEQLEVDFKALLIAVEEILGELLDDLLQDFVHCRWNKRAWTLQEYFASKVIHFYTQDWKPYLPITDVRHADTDVHHTEIGPTNHKEHRAIQRGMQLVTGLVAARLASLKPGSADVRQKLRLASAREATRREDVAYSLLGIFRVTIETPYGADEEPRAFGRLLGALLTGSGDLSILAWIGKPSEYNTCLPSEITVYQQKESQHIPGAIEEANLQATLDLMRSHMSESDLKSAIALHARLLDAPPPEVNHGRLKLSCILFSVSSVRQNSSCSYTADVPLLGKVEIETTDDLYSAQSLILVHPWFKRLLDPGIPLSDSVRRDRALKLLASLRQPFGALLLALTTREYERIATDAQIRVQIPEEVSPEKLLEIVHVLHIR